VRAIAEGLDRQVEPMRQIFYYLPIVHDEQLISQVAAVALFEGLIPRLSGNRFAQVSLAVAKLHRDVICAFGRFPGRNEALGRQSTDQESKFLERYPSGLGPVAETEG